MRLHLPKRLLAALLAACFALPAVATQYRWGDADPETSTEAGPEKSADGTTWTDITYDASHTLTNATGSITFSDAGDYLITGIPEGGWNSGASVVAPTVSGVEQKVASAWFSATENNNKRIYMTGENISKMSNIFLTGVHFVVGTSGTSSTTHTIASNLFLGAGVWGLDTTKVHNVSILRANVDTVINGVVSLVDNSVQISTWADKDITFSDLAGAGKTLSIGSDDSDGPTDVLGSVINLNGETTLGALSVGTQTNTSGELTAMGRSIRVVIGEQGVAKLGDVSLLSGSTLTNNGQLSIGGTYTGNTIRQSSSSSLILKDGAVVNLDGLEQQTICSATESGSQSYYTQYVLSTHDIGSIEEGATVQFKLSNQKVAGTFNEGAYTLSTAAGTCYHIASGDTVSYSSLASAETGDFINVVGTLTADAVITKSVNLAGGTLVGKGNDVTGTLSITKDSTLELNGDMSLTGAISSVSGHTLIVSLNQGVTSGALTISALNGDGEVNDDAQVGKLNYGTLQIEDGVTVNVSGQKGGNAQIAGDIVVNGGGTLKLTTRDTLGYEGGNYTGNITLEGSTTIVDGVSTPKVATLNLTATATQTLTTNLILKGNTSITGEAMNSYGGSITVTGTNNIIGNDVEARKLLSINVKNAGDSLQMTNITRSEDNYRAYSFTKKGAGLLTITGNVGASGKIIENATVEAGKMEVRGEFYGKLTQQGGETVLGGKSTITTMDCTGGSVEMKGANSTIATLTGSGSLKVSGDTGVTDASDFSGSLESAGATLNIKSGFGAEKLAALKISGGVIGAKTGDASVTSVSISEVVLAGGMVGVTAPDAEVTVQTGSLTVSGSSMLYADLELTQNGTLTLNSSLTMGSALTYTMGSTLTLNSGITLSGSLLTGWTDHSQALTLFSGVDFLTLGSGDTAITAEVGKTYDASSVFANEGMGNYKLQMVGTDGNYTVQMVKNAPTPEPTTATLSLLALMGLAARRRRKA